MFWIDWQVTLIAILVLPLVAPAIAKIGKQAAPDRTVHAGADRIDGQHDVRKSCAARASPRPT